MNKIDNIQGEVKLWMNEKGFGFVKTKSYGDVFISKNNLINKQYIAKGTNVLMSIIPSVVKKGEYQATRIEIIEVSNNLFAIVDWYNGKFGVAINGNDEYFIHRSDTVEKLNERDFILFSPTVINGKKSAIHVIRIDNKTKIDLILNRILTAFRDSTWKMRIRLVKGMALEVQLNIFSSYIKKNGITNEDAMNYFKLGLSNSIELPPFDIEYLINNLDIIQDEEIIKSFTEDVYKMFLEKYLVLIHNTLEISPQNDIRFFKTLSLINDEDTFLRYKTTITEYFRKTSFISSNSYSQHSIFDKKRIIDIVPNILKEYLINDYIQNGVLDTDLLPLLKAWGWKVAYFPFFDRIQKLFNHVDWDYAYEGNSTKKEILAILPLEIQIKLIKEYIASNEVMDKNVYSIVKDWYGKTNTKDEVIDSYINEYQEFTNWYSGRDYDNLEILDARLDSFRVWINRCSSSFFSDYFRENTIRRNFVNTYNRFRMLETALYRNTFYHDQEIKLYVLGVFSEANLAKIYESKKETLKLNKFSYVSSQLSKTITKLTNFEFAEMLNNYTRLFRQKDISFDNIEFVDNLRLWIFNLSDNFDFNHFCYYFFMLNRLEQWMFSKKANALMGEEIKQSMLRQRIPWQFSHKKDENIWIYEATWKSIWFENKKVKILTNEENSFSDPFIWEFSEYKFNFLYDYIVGRRLEPLVIEFDIIEGKIVLIENLDALSEILFKAEIQRLVEKGDKENLDKLLSGELMKIPIPINSVLRNECLIYLNRLQLNGLEPTRLLERTINVNNRGLSFEQSFLYTIPLENDDFAIIWESLEIDKSKATHIFKCKIQDYKDIFSDIQSFLSSYTGVRSILNSKNELLERKANLGYYRKIDHDNFTFEKWKDKLHSVLPSLSIVNETLIN